MGLAKDIHETKMLILDSLTNERAGGGRGGQCKKPKKKKKKDLEGSVSLIFALYWLHEHVWKRPLNVAQDVFEEPTSPLWSLGAFALYA